jgi:hypothetical protein
MLCVCNTSGEARDTTLKLDAAALNAGRQPTARDLVSGQTVPVKDGAISVRVGGYEYRLVEVR